VALSAVAVGVFVPASIALIIVALFTHISTASVAALMIGGRAGRVAVVLAAAICLLKPQFVAHPRIVLAFALVAGGVTAMRPVSPFAVLLAAGAAGALLLKPRWVLALYWLFLRAVFLSFSGFATVPLLRDALVPHHALPTDVQLNDAIAISQASPGPHGIYVVVVGYFVLGVPGAIAGALALATPAPLAISIVRLMLSGQSAALKGACGAIVVASCALMVVTGVKCTGFIGERLL
jgi:chromate transport protein ChrA